MRRGPSTDPCGTPEDCWWAD